MPEKEKQEERKAYFWIEYWDRASRRREETRARGTKKAEPPSRERRNAQELDSAEQG